ncbi:hypothetical protein [Sinorhizobium medicae]
MLVTVEIITIVLVAIATALALAHALEWPGKLRLPKDQYLAIQAIYYPGFTIGGVAEPLSLLFTAALLVLMPRGTPAFLDDGRRIDRPACNACHLLDPDASGKQLLAQGHATGKNQRTVFRSGHRSRQVCS